MKRTWIILAGLLAIGAFSGAFAFAREDGTEGKASTGPPGMVEPRTNVAGPPELSPVAPLPSLRSRQRPVAAPAVVRSSPPRRRRRRRAPRIRSTPAPAPRPAPAPLPIRRPAPRPAPKPDEGKKFYDSG
jgi:hypothetical protein